jgi:2-oxoglutarate ferredoxin oxidoreductase subunit beta
MSYISKPRVPYAGIKRNKMGLTIRDYEGGMSTLCAGCGHDSITAALVQAFFELEIEPHKVAKLSGIGCSSKTPAYFLDGAHGLNSVHGRMPAIATGANAVNRDLYCVGVSGDGDSLSIGLGQFAHAIRRNVNMLYIIENNGVYGLTKGQFSASADLGSKAKKGEANRHLPIDPVVLALSVGATYVARSFSGDKDQLIPILKGGLMHNGFALIDVISPCVTFNDHAGSTKSYAHTREHVHETVRGDFVPPAEAIEIEYNEGSVTPVRLHDGSHILLRKVAPEFSPGNRSETMAYLEKHQAKGEIVTGLLFLDEGTGDLHQALDTADRPLNEIEYDELCPGEAGLEDVYRMYR